MISRLWKLPWLRSRTKLQRGVYGAICATLILGFGATDTIHSYVEHPTQPFLLSIGGIGMTLFIAYVVGMSGFLRESGVRSGDQATLVGVLAGLGFCGLAAVGVVCGLAANTESSGWLRAFAFAWASMSLILLGGMISALPIFAYEGGRSKHINPDE
jgi:hypothetical protein